MTESIHRFRYSIPKRTEIPTFQIVFITWNLCWTIPAEFPLFYGPDNWRQTANANCSLYWRSCYAVVLLCDTFNGIFLFLWKIPYRFNSWQSVEFRTFSTLLVFYREKISFAKRDCLSGIMAQLGIPWIVSCL